MPEHEDRTESHEFQRPEEPELIGESWQGREDDGNDAPKKLLLMILVGLVLLGFAGAWWWWSSFKAASGEQEPVATTTPDGPVEEPVEPLAPTEEQPEEPVSLANADEMLRRLVGEVSAHPRLAAWLVNEGLIERFVRVTANVAYGEDPRSHVPFLRPGRSFETTERDGVEVISTGSYSRYTPIVEVVESLDVEGSAELYRRFEPAMEEAFAELGYPGSFRETLDRAVRRLRAVEVPSGPVEVEEGVLSYRYADPELETSDDLDKLLYRMGEENVTRLQEAVSRLAAALP